MVPSRFQLPRPPPGTSATVTGEPPDASMVLSLASAKNPSERLSADQKGSIAPSVPGSGLAEGESRERSHSMVFPVASVAPKAKVRPSGEIAGAPPKYPESVVKRVFSGGSISEMVVRAGAVARRQYDIELTITPKRNTAAIAQGEARCGGKTCGRPGTAPST